MRVHLPATQSSHYIYISQIVVRCVAKQVFIWSRAREFVIAGANANSHFLTLGNLLLAGRDWTFMIGSGLVWSFARAYKLDFALTGSASPGIPVDGIYAFEYVQRAIEIVKIIETEKNSKLELQDAYTRALGWGPI